MEFVNVSLEKDLGDLFVFDVLIGVDVVEIQSLENALE